MKEPNTQPQVDRRGGKREGAGRKRTKVPLVTYRVHIRMDQADLLALWGDGDVSAGLRWLVDAAKVQGLVRKE